MRRLDGITNSMDMSLGKPREVDMSLGKPREMVMDRGPGMLQSMGSQRVGQNQVTELN